MIQLCQKIAAAPAFERGIIAVILLNGVLVGVETMPAVMQHHGEWLLLGNQVVLAVFILEAARTMPGPVLRAISAKEVGGSSTWLGSSR